MGILSHKITCTHMDIIAVWDCLFSTVIAGKYLFGEFMHFYALWNIVLSLSTVLQNTKLLLNSSTDVKSQWGAAHWIYKSCHCIFLAHMSLPESWTGLHYCLHCYFSVQNFSGEIWLEQLILIYHLYFGFLFNWSVFTEVWPCLWQRTFWDCWTRLL